MQAPDSGVLFQEELRNEPFWMLVACILVNRTHWRQARAALAELRARCEGAKDLVDMDRATLERILKPLGFMTSRYRALKNMSALWIVRGVPKDHLSVLALPGCGVYAAQSWEIFIEGRRPLGEVADHKLQWYLDQHPELV